MKMPFGTEVDLGPGHNVLDGKPAPRKGHSSSLALFLAHVDCGHGRPSQLLLIPCYIGYFSVKHFTSIYSPDIHRVPEKDDTKLCENLTDF